MSTVMVNNKSWNRIAAAVSAVAAMLLCGVYAGPAFVLIVLAAALAALSWRFPAFWLWCVPLLLVAGDSYCLTGTLIVKEREVLLLAVLAGKLLAPKTHYGINRSLVLRWLPFLAVLFVGFCSGWLSLPEAGLENHLGVYGSKWNALRLGVPFFVGILYTPLVHQAFRAGEKVRDANWKTLSLGFQLAAAYVCLFAVADRLRTVGLLNLDEVLRTAGPFYSMHIGGQHIDAFWALTVPFVFRFRSGRGVKVYAAWALQLLSLYVIFATMSRALIAYTVVSIVGIAYMQLYVFFQASDKLRVRLPTPRPGMAVALVLCATLLWLGGNAVPGRFQQSSSSLKDRTDHWLRLSTIASERMLFGHGLGTYPVVYREKTGEVLAPISLLGERKNHFARLYAGQDTFLEQTIITTSAPLPWQIQAEVSGPATLGISLCHKSLLQSYDCVRPEPSPDNRFSFRVTQIPNDLIDQDRSPWLREYCPVTFGVAASGKPGEYVDLHRFSVTAADGTDVIANPDFNDGSWRWFFTTDDHLVYHSKNVWTHLAVELGTLGVLAVAFPMLFVAWRLLAMATAGTTVAALVLAWSLLGFLLLGIFSTMLDTAWTVEMLVLLLAAGEGLLHGNSATHLSVLRNAADDGGADEAG